MSEIVEVVVDVPVREEEGFHYRVPPRLQGKVRPGHRVLVPFGRRKVQGIVVGFPQFRQVKQLKEIIDLADHEPLLTAEMLALARWMSHTYLSPLRDCLLTMLPAGISLHNRVYARVVDAVGLESLLQAEFSERTLSLGKEIQERAEPVEERVLRRLGGRDWRRLLVPFEQAGVVEVFSRWEDPKVQPKKAKAYRAEMTPAELKQRAVQLRGRAPAQSALLEWLAEHGPEESWLATELEQRAGVSRSVLRALERSGMLQGITVEVQRRPKVCWPDLEEARPRLTAAQEKAIQEVKSEWFAGRRRPVLLHGVTGSGKTEVYLSLIELALQRRQQVIMLVPEIALTPQTVGLFQRRFGSEVAVQHSGLSLGERYDQWRLIRNGEASIVVGARSAVFAPVTRLGLIVVDEEHEPSYKQENSPAYHARDVALQRAVESKAQVVMGSATPSLESYYAAEKGRYKLIELKKRVPGSRLPDVSIVDMRQELKAGNRTMFSRELVASLTDCLSRGCQAILFMNRRGFANFVLCRSCGLVLSCPHCDVSLTYHKGGEPLRCHYCGYHFPLPDKCPQCRSLYLRPFGAGTQKVEHGLQEYFPGVRCLRLDSDVARRKGAHEQILGSFRRREAEVLIGTQMVSKGLDCPGVTLVGVLAADHSLRFPDVRAGERTFQLLTQVAGRAGRRSQPGKVVVQTYNPDHYSVGAASQHDYQSFYNQELVFRRQGGYPPYTHLARVVISSTSEGAAGQWAARVARLVSQARSESREAEANKTATELEVLGPTPAPLQRVKGRYRWQVVLKHPLRERIRDVLEAALEPLLQEAAGLDLTLKVDIDPVTML